MNNFDDGGDDNPPKGSIERPHKLTLTNKIKIQTNQERTNEVEPQDEISLENIDLDANIDDT
jgi:hypothetical protein